MVNFGASELLVFRRRRGGRGLVLAVQPLRQLRTAADRAGSRSTSARTRCRRGTAYEQQVDARYSGVGDRHRPSSRSTRSA